MHNKNNTYNLVHLYGDYVTSMIPCMQKVVAMLKTL